VGSQRAATPGHTRPHTATEAAGELHTGPRLATRGDGRSVHGMQEVRSSSLRSSTGQIHDLNSGATDAAARYSNGDRESNRTCPWPWESPRVWPGVGSRWWPGKSPHPLFVVPAGSLGHGRRRWRCQQVTVPARELPLKYARERMDIISAYREVGTYRLPAWRRSTAFSCRSTSSSASFARSPRNARPSTRRTSK
jgi:hypothetical protein